MSISCMIVDDDEVSRKIASQFIEMTNFLALRHECSSAIDAANILNEDDVDIVFLDFFMPGMNGMELVKGIKSSPEIIMTTSAQQFAVEAYENSVTDYLVKPLEYGRFLTAVNKAKRNIESFKLRVEKQNDIYVKADSRLVRIGFSDLLYVEAMADYVIMHTKTKNHIVHSTMKGIMKRLPSSIFARVHRSFIINVTKINFIEDYAVSMQDKMIPIGASYKDSFMELLNTL